MRRSAMILRPEHKLCFHVGHAVPCAPEPPRPGEETAPFLSRGSCSTPFLLTLALLGTVTLLRGAELTRAHTNWTERWITNQIEVRMPTNLFVNKFHTNWMPEFVTNEVEVYATNWLTARVTNVIPVQVTHTVHFTEYKTNWNTETLTNLVIVEKVRTNFVELWKTNWQTLTLTNWNTVAVMRTNWVTQSVTNSVQIDPSTNRAVIAGPAPASATASTPVSTQLSSATLTDALQLHASRTSRSGARNVVEVRLQVSWRVEPTASVHVQQWRVESEVGAILCLGQEPEFRRELPLGKYKVQVKVQRQVGGQVLAARGTLLVSPNEVTIQQHPLEGKLTAARAGL